MATQRLFLLWFVNGHIISCCHFCMLNHVNRTTNVDAYHLAKSVYLSLILFELWKWNVLYFFLCCNRFSC